ncbi:hypothetical protein JX265_009507 [Neoarthrinium moseri]|uniref:Uncharacterized protein n=1 Tax=Neoarthrinium moseri TaxID=1658444 RepID=A0A9Q0AL63_9PEZI|nr:hypothetical protein JX265_009507 [Neoarthrinium moseri]
MSLSQSLESVEQPAINKCQEPINSAHDGFASETEYTSSDDNSTDMETGYQKNLPSKRQQYYRPASVSTGSKPPKRVLPGHRASVYNKRTRYDSVSSTPDKATSLKDKLARKAIKYTKKQIQQYANQAQNDLPPRQVIEQAFEITRAFQKAHYSFEKHKSKAVQDLKLALAQLKTDEDHKDMCAIL